RMPASFPAGTSNTMLFATRFMQCGSGNSSGGSYWGGGPNTNGSTGPANGNPILPNGPNPRHTGTPPWPRRFGPTFGWFATNVTNVNYTGVAGTGGPFFFQPAPTQALCNPVQGSPQAFAPQAIQVALCDASVRSCSAQMTLLTWQRAHNPWS